MDRLHSMRVFSRVVDEGSFARAARELNLSPAVVTRLVADLEEHLGSRLINRTTRRMALTEEGRIYLEYVTQGLDALARADQVLGPTKLAPSGTLRVSAPMTLTLTRLSGAIVQIATNALRQRRATTSAAWRGGVPRRSGSGRKR